MASPDNEPMDETTRDTPEVAPKKPSKEVWKARARAAQETHKEKFAWLKNAGRKYWDKKKWTLPASVVVLLLLLLAIPPTRYMLVGLFMKEQVTVTVTDSTTSTPVSGADVSLAGHDAKTDGQGVAKLKVKPGSTTLAVTKQYYKTYSASITVTLSKSHNTFKLKLVATGRQVPVKVVNKITGKPLAGAEIKVLNTEAKTDKNGMATIVLPTKDATQKGSVSLGGYNGTSVTVQVSAKVLPANTFSITPSGKLYFLSNQTGKIDVVKTNLDGTDRQTVLAGTGSEDPNNTALLASRDWKYLALLSLRTAGASPQINIINTSNDGITDIESGDATFNFVGWSGDDFVYIVNRNNYKEWQPGASSIKSYDAQAGKLLVLDSTDAAGSSEADAKFDTYFANVLLLGNQVVFTKTWYIGPGYISVTGQQNKLISVSPDGTNKKTISTQDAENTYFGGLYPYKAQEILVQVSSSSGNPDTFYELDSSGNYTQDTDSDASQVVLQPYPTYLQSPSGKQTFWTEQRDGKNALFVGDGSGNNEKQIADLSEYTPYGWYTDNYLLVSKNSSELYIMPADGSGSPQKISDYYKPPLTFRGYGGGYGGF